MAEITYTFTGANNVLDPADVGAPDPKKRDLVFTEVVELVNTDMSDTGSVSLRSGRTPVANGAGYHSGWSNPYTKPTEAYYVRNGSLWRMTPGQDIPALKLIRSNLLDLPMCFTQVNDVVRYSNGVQCGVIENGVDTPPFVPSDPFKHPMVAGRFEELFNGRLYALVDNFDGVSGCSLICSDPMDVPGWIESMDERYNVVETYDGAAKGICRVNDGLFVSAGEETFFHAGKDAVVGDGFEQVSVALYPMIPGTVRPIKAELLGVQGLKEWACIWASTRGVCVGGNGGFFENQTQEQVSYPAGVEGTAVVRESGGVSHYVFVLRAPGGEYNKYTPRVGA